MLHCWFSDVTYRNLSTDEINRSRERAKAIGGLVKAARHAVAIWPKPEEKK